MIKLSDLKFVNTDTPFPVAALELLSAQMNIVAHFYKKIGENYTSELLHDMRVSFRRLQAMMNAFMPHLTDDLNAGKKSSNILTAIRDMIRVLSKARTFDVSFEIVNEYLKKFNGNLTLNLLSGELRVRKVKALDKMYKSDVFIRFGKQIKKISRFLDFELRKNISDEIKNSSFREVYSEIIIKGFERSIVNTSVIFFPSDMTAFIHAYRIALKPLRYLFDIGESSFGTDFDKMKDKIKNLVELLGDFNDCSNTFDISEKIIKNDELRNPEYLRYLFMLRKKMLSMYDDVCISLKALKQENIKLIFT